ncbi:structural maintenance of chromosomes protein 4-like [Gracilinanus agilis]|uniref:structural maintenance of chromosomes protein 4-like n=1 Tax=Gracilinanus agilis TaxID=191870 RepID=UPI001CFDADB1|nr:structural maintenance of chromosomes protein 4-like [Gracilinanus agilis]
MITKEGTPRLMITHIVNLNFKSYAGRTQLGPFHKHFSCIIGPNGSGKSNVIDSMLFVFGCRAHKIRSKKLAVLIHHSDEYQDLDSCTVEVHFQKIIDKAGEDYDVIPDSSFYVSRTAYKNNTSVYHISGKKQTFRDVGNLLRSHGIDLDHNRFLILQGEVEQIALMKPKGQSEHDEGMLEYLEDIIGSGRLKEPIEVLSQRLDVLTEEREEKLKRVKIVEKEREYLEVEKNIAIDFLTLENEILIKKNHICQFYIYDLHKRIAEVEYEKDKILEETEAIKKKTSKLEVEMNAKTDALNEAERKLNQVSKFIEESKEKYTQLDLEGVQVKTKMKYAKSKAKKLEKQLQKDKEKVEDFKDVPADNEKVINETTAKKSTLEEEKEKEEEKMKEVMDSLKQETKELQEEKESQEKELLEFNKTVNEARSKMDVAQSELDIYLSLHNTAVSKLSEAQKALTTTSETLKERKTAIRDLEIKLPPTEQDLKEKESEFQNLTKEAIDLDSSVRDLLQKVEEAKSSLTTNQSRGKVLNALIQQKMSGKIRGIYGRLGDLGAIDEKYNIAISSCCSALDYIVVNTIDTAQICVNFLKKQNIGVATFIGLDKIKVSEKNMNPLPTPENIPRLFDLVKAKDEKIRRAFYFALRDTLVADNLDQATRVAFQKDKRWRVVTLQGQIIEQSGTMTGGGSKPMKGRIGSSLVVEVSEEELAMMESKLQKDSQRAIEVQERKAQLEGAILKLRHSVQDMRNTLEKFTASIQSLSEQEAYLDVQVKELKANVRDTTPDEKKQKLLETQINTFKEEYECVSLKAGKVEAEVKRLHDLIMEINNHKLKAQQDKLDKINKKLDQCASVVTKAKVAVRTADRNLKKAQNSVLRTEKEITDNDQELEDLTNELKNLTEEATDVMKNSKEAGESLPEIQKEHHNLLQEMKGIKENECTLQNDSLSNKLKLAQVDTYIAEQLSKVRFWEQEMSRIALHRIEDNPVEQISLLSQEDLEEIENPNFLNNQIDLLESQCNQMNPNLDSIEEYKKKNEQYLHRMRELEKITIERDRYRRAYKDLRERRLNEFMAGFTVITNKLKENYQMLTLGGDAELELIDSLDPFSEGIMFSVRPPQKSWKKIFNLSGGEKTLSSLALVFALHDYKPTPLYFMDEIDAALDFKNVFIVAYYIYKQKKDAQFIIISLRNNMFEIADRLIGIYKTHNITKSVTINPKAIAAKGVC